MPSYPLQARTTTLGIVEKFNSPHNCVNGGAMINRESIGRRLIYFAWGVEIVAASIGLVMAALIILTTRQKILDTGAEITASGYMDIFLGGLPFIVVAMVELTKIPLATACYVAANRAWKTAFAIVLIVLSVVTFETILNGFERNFTLRTYLLSIKKKEITNLEERIEKTKQDVENPSRANDVQIRQAYLADSDQIEKEKQAALDDIEKERNEARIRYGGEEAKLKDEQRKTVEEDLRKLEERLTNETTTIDNRYAAAMERIDESVRDNQSRLSTQIEELEAELADSQRREQERLSKVRESGDTSALLAQEVARITEDFDQRIADQVAQTEKLRRNLDDRITVQRADIKADESDMQNKLDKATIFVSKEKIRGDYNARLNPMRENLKGLEEQRKNLSTNRAIGELHVDKDQQIAAAQSRFADQGSRAERKREQIRIAFAGERQPIQQQFEIFRREFAVLSTNSQIDLATTRRDDDLVSLNEEIESRRVGLRARRDKLSEEILQIASRSDQTLQPVLQRLDDRRTSIIDRADRRNHDAQQKHEANIARLAGQDAEIRRKENELKDMRDQRIVQRKDLARQAQENQMYRVTALLFGKETPADITNAELRLVTGVWFGSLAAITAWTGTFLAFGGLVVRYGPRERQPGLVSRAARAWFIDRRRRVRRPIIKIVEKEVVKTVEVVKEVPVNKVVFTEVPKEIIHKELVHVPLFTDDPELLGVRPAGKGGGGRSAKVKKPKAQ